MWLYGEQWSTRDYWRYLCHVMMTSPSPSSSSFSSSSASVEPQHQQHCSPASRLLGTWSCNSPAIISHISSRETQTANMWILVNYPRESEGICFHRRWFVCLCVCLSVITITKTIVDGFVPNFTGRFLGGKGRPSSCFVTIGRGMWK